MELYCGIDLHSTNHMVTILDEANRRVLERRLANDVLETIRTLEPFREHLVGIAVESTFNWYWLVDGLMEAGFRLHLVNTAGVQKYSGLKYVDDRHDARWLAHLLRLGIEAARCPDIRPVPVKSVDQQALQQLHRLRC